MRQILTLTVSGLLLAACGVTTPSSVTNAERLTAIQSTLIEARNTTPRAGYTNYLAAIEAASPELIELTQLSDSILSGPDNDNKLLGMMVALQAAGYLADLPVPTQAESDAIAAASAFIDDTERMCANTPAKRECVVSAAEAATLYSRVLAADVLGAAFETPSSETVMTGFLSFEETLPPTDALASSEAGEELVRIALTEQGCTLNRAEPFLRVALGNDNVPALRQQFQSTMMALFPKTTLSLCADGGDSCAQAVSCGGDDLSDACAGHITSAFINYCSPDTAGLREHIEAGRTDAGS